MESPRQVQGRLGVVVGLEMEADCLRPAFPATAQPPLIAISGANSARAGAAAQTLIEQGVSHLLSFGLAGGLDPRHQPGTLIVASCVIAPGGRRFLCDPEWSERLLGVSRDGPGLLITELAGSDRPVAGLQEKRRLFEATRATAVDMESHVVAAVAAEARIPFLAIRAIADPAQRAIPRAALAGVAPDGRQQPLAVLVRLLGRPWEIAPLLRLALDSRAAIAALRRVACRGVLFP
jgi:hopanoid-associated phosphorylase